MRKQKLDSSVERVKRNVSHLRTEPPALRWMGKRIHLPNMRDPTVLEGVTRLGMFWNCCQTTKRCTKPPYDRLLTNPVLKADYRSHPS